MAFEHFRAQWAPVRVKEMRWLQELGCVSDAGVQGNAANLPDDARTAVKGCGRGRVARHRRGTFAAFLALLFTMLVGVPSFAQQAPAAPPEAVASPAPVNGPSGTAGGAPSASPAPAEAAPAAAAPPAPAQAEAPKPAALPPDPLLVAARSKIDEARASLASIESTLAVEGLRTADLEELRNRISPIRKDLVAQSETLSTQLSSLRTQLASFPPAPTDGASEDPILTADRSAVKTQVGAYEGVLAPVRALTERADAIADRISTRRRALFTEQLFERSASVLSPTLWGEALAGTQSEARAVQLLMTDWTAYAERKHGGAVALGILAGTLGIIVLVVVAGRMVRARLRTPPPPEGVVFSRFRSALEALKVLLLESVVAPLAVTAGVTFMSLLEMVPPRVDALTFALSIAVLFKALGTATARAVLAPGEPWRRLLSMSDHDAQVAFKYFSWAVWTLAVALFLLFLHRTLFAPLALTVVTSALMALMIAGFLARFLVYLSRKDTGETTDGDEAQEEGTEARQSPQWIRFLVWILVALMTAALVGGYVSFAALVARRLVAACVILGAVYLVYVLIDTVFDEKQMRGSHRVRVTARVLGLSTMTVELVGVIVSGLLKFMLLVLTALLLVESWGATAGDMMDITRDFTFSLQIGAVSISPWGVLMALVLLLVGIGIARAIQRWVTTSLLPRTGLEPSLQSSISTIVGYIGYIAALMVAMSELGLSLENVALVAGALSVGIGFGLQSIVNNFVSGIILLAERPIRVGDTINVKGEEGSVRRISVRSTEIETADRATVIVPNSDLITGMVKNFTHANTTGRIIIAVNAPYDADPELVRDLLVGCAYDHPQVLRNPPPRVFLLKFTDMGLGFELRCVVANVDYSSTVRSDLHFKVLERFREAGIGFPSQPWAALGRAPVALVPEMGEGETGAEHVPEENTARRDEGGDMPAPPSRPGGGA